LSPSTKNPYKILIDASHNERVKKFPEKIFKKSEFLFDFTSGADILANADELKKYDVIVLGDPKPKTKNERLFTAEEISAIKKYVKEGGRLLITSGARGDYALAETLGSLRAFYGISGVVQYHYAVLYHSAPECNFESKMCLTIPNIPKHAIFSNFSNDDRLIFGKSTYLTLHPDSKAKVILTAPKGSKSHSYRNKEKKAVDDAALMVVNKYHEGKVMAVASSDFLNFEDITPQEQKSNEKLLKGILSWLFSAEIE
jgi:uncharacterized membrane protein